MQDMKILYHELLKEQLTEALFADFNRYQEVKRCWRKDMGKWVLKDIAFVDNWTDEEKQFLVKCLRGTCESGGAVYGASYNGILIGFASLESLFFGSAAQYLQLSSLHVSYPYRGRGIGRHLFDLICCRAAQMGAKKLYISSHSAEETQAFYRKMGCVEAGEYNQKLVDKEPCDCQIEYDLNSHVLDRP